MRENTDQLIKDFEKVFNAHYNAPPEKKAEAMEKALREVWEERRREKAAGQQEEDKGKK